MIKIPKTITNLLMIGVITIIGFLLFGVYVVQDKYEPENNQTEWDKNNMRDINSDDKLLIDSKQTAKSNLPYFISEFQKKSNTDFFTKIKLTENGKTEHIWIEILSLDNDKSIGLLSNVPKYFKNLKYLDTVTFDINKSEDLMITRNDSIVFGGFLKTELEKK